MNHRNALLALHLTGVVGPRRLLSVKNFFHDFWDVFGTDLDQLSSLTDWNLSSARKVISCTRPRERVDYELEKAESLGVKVWVEGDEDFPKVFANLYDPPFVLWCKGHYKSCDEKGIAVVGCRKPTAYGFSASRQLSEQIASYGYTVISGLARGIDSAAHEGALSVPNGRTIAFLGSGLNEIYPPENRSLAERIADHGAVISEYPLDARPLALHFPQRNRLISGASRGVLVVEAGEGSGSLITVDHALEQGKTVFAVPGPIQAPQSQGTHELIRQGAKLVMRAEDILLELGELISETVINHERGTVRPSGTLTEEENGLMEFISFTPIHLDGLSRESGLPARRLSEMMLVLEMKGYVKQLPGNQFVKA
jgi:DNA processing protein